MNVSSGPSILPALDWGVGGPGSSSSSFGLLLRSSPAGLPPSSFLFVDATAARLGPRGLSLEGVWLFERLAAMPCWLTGRWLSSGDPPSVVADLNDPGPIVQREVSCCKTSAYGSWTSALAVELSGRDRRKKAYQKLIQNGFRVCCTSTHQSVLSEVIWPSVLRPQFASLFAQGKFWPICKRSNLQWESHPNTVLLLETFITLRRTLAFHPSRLLNPVFIVPSINSSALAAHLITSCSFHLPGIPSKTFDFWRQIVQPHTGTLRRCHELRDPLPHLKIRTHGDCLGMSEPSEAAIAKMEAALQQTPQVKRLIVGLDFGTTYVKPSDF